MIPEQAIPDRRTDDARITQIEQRMSDFELLLKANTDVTQEVRDILGSFKILGTLAKWGAAIVGTGMGAYHAVTSLLGRGQP